MHLSLFTVRVFRRFSVVIYLRRALFDGLD